MLELFYLYGLCKRLVVSHFLNFRSQKQKKAAGTVVLLSSLLKTLNCLLAKGMILAHESILKKLIFLCTAGEILEKKLENIFIDRSTFDKLKDLVTERSCSLSRDFSKTALKVCRQR